MFYKKFKKNFKFLEMIGMKIGRIGYNQKNFDEDFVFFNNGYIKNISKKTYNLIIHINLKKVIKI